MGITSQIRDFASGYRLKISKFGQASAGPPEYSELSYAETLTPNIAYNLIPPKTGNSIVISAYSIFAGKNVDVLDPQTVQIYATSQGDTSTSLDKVLVKSDLTRGQYSSLTGMNLIIPEGQWVNTLAEDSAFYVSVYYYYLENPKE